MGPGCHVSSSREHPVIDWADAHPAQLAGLDLRDELPAYREAIRGSLTRHARVPTR